jgi:hypothetical protein
VSVVLPPQVTSLHPPQRPVWALGAFLSLQNIFYNRPQMLVALSRLATFTACLIAGWWAYRDPKFDSWFALAVAVAAFLSSFVVPAIANRRTMVQTVGNNSTAVQAGRDASVRAERNDRDAR